MNSSDDGSDDDDQKVSDSTPESEGKSKSAAASKDDDGKIPPPAKQDGEPEDPKEAKFRDEYNKAITSATGDFIDAGEHCSKTLKNKMRDISDENAVKLKKIFTSMNKKQNELLVEFPKSKTILECEDALNFCAKLESTEEHTRFLIGLEEMALTGMEVLKKDDRCGFIHDNVMNRAIYRVAGKCHEHDGKSVF